MVFCRVTAGHFIGAGRKRKSVIVWYAMYCVVPPCEGHFLLPSQVPRSSNGIKPSESIRKNVLPDYLISR